MVLLIDFSMRNSKTREKNYIKTFEYYFILRIATSYVTIGNYQLTESVIADSSVYLPRRKP